MEEGESEVLIDENLFLNEETTLVREEIGEDVELLESGTMSCTEHDLTGQIIWPVSRLLALFVCEWKEKFARKRVLELGAGAGFVLARKIAHGLSGLVASRYALSTVLTDGNEVVMRLLEKNASRSRLEKGRKVESATLQWEEERRNEQLSRCIDLLGGNPQVVLGADVVQWPEAIVPLVQTVVHILSRGGTDAFFACGLVARSKWLRRRFLSTCEEYCLRMEPWTASTILQNDPVLSTCSDAGDMEVLIFRWNPASD